MTEKWYLKSQEEIESTLKTNAATGLDPAAAALRLKEEGGNNIFTVKRRFSFGAALRESLDFSAILLIFILLISGITKETLMCIAVTVLAILLRTVLYRRAVRTFGGLALRGIPKARVRRGGVVRLVDARKLVPGDILLLRHGELVPADARVLAAKNLSVREYAVTGNRGSAEKSATIPNLSGQVAVSSLTNMVFAGSRVAGGSALAVVTDTGAETLTVEFNGRIPLDAYDKLPVMRRITHNNTTCDMIMLGLVILAALLGILTGGEISIIRSFVLSFATAVTAVGECYFAYSSYILARSVEDMDDDRADSVCVKSLPAFDTLRTVDFVLIRDRFSVKDAGAASSFVRRLNANGIRAILLTDKPDYDDLLLGKLSAFAERRESFVTRQTFHSMPDETLWYYARGIGVCSGLDRAERLRFLRVLQMNGAKVAALSPDGEDADLLKEADVGFAYADLDMFGTGTVRSSAEKTRQLEETQLAADIILPKPNNRSGGIVSLYRCICAIKNAYLRLNVLFTYFAITVTARAVLCFYAVFVPESGFSPLHILLGGFLPDLIFASVLAATGAGKRVLAFKAEFRYTTISAYGLPVATGALSAVFLLLVHRVEILLGVASNSGFLFVGGLALSVFMGVYLIGRYKAASAPSEWMPSVLFLLGTIAFTALTSFVPFFGNLFFVEGISGVSILLAMLAAALGVFGAKLLFGAKIIPQNY